MKNEKDFDAVKMMREIRDKMSKEMQGMDTKKRMEYINKKTEFWIKQRPEPASN